jgi:hypothetical protein
VSPIEEEPKSAVLQELLTVLYQYQTHIFLAKPPILPPHIHIAINPNLHHIKRHLITKCLHHNPKINRKQAVPQAPQPPQVHLSQTLILNPLPPPNPTQSYPSTHPYQHTSNPPQNPQHPTVPNATKHQKTQKTNPSKPAQPANPCTTAPENAQKHITRSTKRNVQSWLKNTLKPLFLSLR